MWKDAIKVVTKLVTATRLSTAPMRTSQGSSAILAALPIVGARARGMLVKSFAEFSTGQLTANQQSDVNFNKVLSRSSTASRSGLEQQKPGAYQDQTKKRKAVGIPRKVWDASTGALERISDATLDATLGQSDKVAANAVFGAFYYDRMLQTRGSEVKNFTNKQFWEWSANNVDMGAITWADEQVSRSMMLSLEFNNGKALSNKMLSNTLFPFGSFSYNRKVGMANDWSILADKNTASTADKAKAARRLASATIEIGVFKLIQPMVHGMIAKSFAGYIANLVGWDDEYDKAVAIYQKAFNYSEPRIQDKRLDKFEVTNYKPKQGQQFYTALVEGLIPIPIPSAGNEFMMAAANDVTGADIFSVYSKDVRSLFVEGDESLTTSDWVEIVTRNMGIATLGMDDMTSLQRAVTNETGRLPSTFFGDDRWVIPSAMPAAERLRMGRFLNVFIQSADLKKLLNSTEALLQRKYTVTKRPDYEAYNKKELGPN